MGPLREYRRFLTKKFTETEVERRAFVVMCAAYIVANSDRQADWLDTYFLQMTDNNVVFCPLPGGVPNPTVIQLSLRESSSDS